MFPAYASEIIAIFLDRLFATADQLPEFDGGGDAEVGGIIDGGHELEEVHKGSLVDRLRIRSELVSM